MGKDERKFQDFEQFGEKEAHLPCFFEKSFIYLFPAGIITIDIHIAYRSPKNRVSCIKN